MLADCFHCTSFSGFKSVVKQLCTDRKGGFTDLARSRSKWAVCAPQCKFPQLNAVRQLTY